MRKNILKIINFILHKKEIIFELNFLDYESQKIYNYFSLGEKGSLKEINQSIIIIDVPIPKIIYDEHFIIDFKLYKNNKEANSVVKSFNLDIYIILLIL